jgi:hypothetical protein
MTKSKSIYEMILDSQGIEMWVQYEYERTIQTYEGHGYHNIDEVDIYIHDVEVVIANKGVSIMKLLNEKQLDDIKERLSLQDDSE